jgi:hypothetical protein
MSTPTVINEEYDIVIAGGELSSTSFSSHFNYLPSANRIDFLRKQVAQLRASLPAVSPPPTRTYAYWYSKLVPPHTTIPRTRNP